MKSDTEPQDAQVLRSLITGYETSQVIHVAARLGVADLLAEVPQTTSSLARALRVDASALSRVLHALAALGLVEQSGEDRYSITRSGTLLRDGVPGSLRGFALLSGERSYRAWGGLLQSVKTGETAFQHVFGMDTFAYMAANPEIAGFYNEAQTAGATERTAAVLAAYEFSAGGTVVDVGGGHGALLIAILSAYPGVQGVLFERESVANGAREHIEAAGLSSRCAVKAGDFFQAVPGEGGIYLLSHIVHNWNDERCGKILANCRAAMPGGARLLILEKVLPNRFDSARTSVQAAMADLHMLAITGGQERTADEYRRLLANGGFTLTNVIVTSVADSLIEAVPI